MSIVRFMGCLHIGHTSIAKYRGFQDEFYHDEYLIEQWNKIVHKRDTTYILGDVTMETSKHYYQLDRLAGRKIVVLGNHDKYQDIPELLKYVDGVAGCVDYKGYFYLMLQYMYQKSVNIELIFMLTYIIKIY